MGEPERGKTLFEGIIDSHPKRWDVWSIYIDMEGRQDNMQSLRYVLIWLPGMKHLISFSALFDRVLTVKMTSHKAKYVLPQISLCRSSQSTVTDPSSRSGWSSNGELVMRKAPML